MADELIGVYQIPKIVTDDPVERVRHSNDLAVAINTAMGTVAGSFAGNGFIPSWKANTAYAAGARVIAPNGDIESAKIAFTSGATYSAANWNPSPRAAYVDATYMPIARGPLTTGTDLDTLRLAEHMGTWGLGSGNTYTNKPSNQPAGSATLEIFRDLGNSLTLIQRISNATDIWWRKAASSTTWAAWVQVETKPGAAASVATARAGAVADAKTYADATFLPINKGSLTTDTDLDTLRLAAHMGAWGMPSANTYTNKPSNMPGAATGTIEIFRDLANNLTLVQRISTATDMWWRKAASSTTWSAWVQAETKAGAAATYMPLSRAVLVDGTDLNTLTGLGHIGTWGMPGTNTYLNKPPGLSATGVIEVLRDTGNSQAILHRITAGVDSWWREATTTGNWSAWVQTATREFVAANYETLTGSALKLQEAKDYADTHGGGGTGEEFEALEGRVLTLEELAGLEPGDVSDATMTSLLNNPDSDFGQGLAEKTSAAVRGGGVHNITNPALAKAARAHTVTVPTYDGSGVAVHPSVYFNPDRWNGWEYWMAMTPYPGEDNDFENPSIVVSRDGETWTVPAGLTNPLDSPSGDIQYMSDPYLMLSNDGTMHCFYRATTATVDRYYLRTSRDGVTWTPRVLVIESDRLVLRHLSASFIQMADNTWTMYGLDSAAVPSRVVRLTAPTPTGAWSAPQVVTFVGAPKPVWHLDVHRVGGEWHMLVMDDTGNGGDLWPAISKDGLTFTAGPVLLPRYPGSWDSYYYKSCFVPAVIDGLAGWDMWVGGALEATVGPTMGRTFVHFSSLSFLGTPGAVTGSRGGNAALASLLTKLVAAGLITDGTTA